MLHHEAIKYRAIKAENERVEPQSDRTKAIFIIVHEIFMKSPVKNMGKRVLRLSFYSFITVEDNPAKKEETYWKLGANRCQTRHENERIAEYLGNWRLYIQVPIQTCHIPILALTYPPNLLFRYSASFTVVPCCFLLRELHRRIFPLLSGPGRKRDRGLCVFRVSNSLV